MSRRNLRVRVSSVPVSFGEAIATRRQELGWTAKRVATAAGVSTKILGQYESGTALPNVERAARIASALRMSLDAAMGLEEPRPFSVAVDGKLYISVSAARAAQTEASGGAVHGARPDAMSEGSEASPPPPEGRRRLRRRSGEEQDEPTAPD